MACPLGRTMLDGKCVFNPKAYEEKNEGALRTYLDSYWISGSTSDLSGDITVNNTFNCSPNATTYTSNCPYLCLNEKQVFNTIRSNTKQDFYDSVAYESIGAYDDYKRGYYAYYVVVANNEVFKDKLYCMNDYYNDFELCNESNEHNG